MKRRRTILGAISGLFFGVFLALDLLLFGVIGLDNLLLTILPVAGLVVGVVLGVYTPLAPRRARKPDIVPPEAAAAAVSGDTPSPVSGQATARDDTGSDDDADETQAPEA